MKPDSTERSDEIDRYLLKQIATGDEDALQVLYKKYSQVLYSTAYEILRNKEEADEAIQDAFVRLWNKAHLYDPEKARAFSWIYQVARRVFLNRRAKKNDLLQFSNEINEFIADPNEHSSEEIETREDLNHHLSEMPEAQQTCLRLALVNGLTAKEISEKTGTPHGTVKTWIRRGVLILRRKFRS